MVQVGAPFAKEIVAEKWAERLYGVFYDTAEPILKMTIAQHISDWLEMYGRAIDASPLRHVARKMAKNALTNGGYGVPKPTSAAVKFAEKLGGGKAKPAAAPAGDVDDKPVDDTPLRDAKSPAPAKKEVQSEETKRAEIITTCFKRYDLDQSGTINTSEELQQLCTNLCFKLKIMVPPGAVDEKVLEMGDLEGRDLNLGEFDIWFAEEFGGYKKMKF